MKYNHFQHTGVYIKKFLTELLKAKGVKPENGFYVVTPRECENFLHELFEELEWDVIVSIKCDLVKCGAVESVRASAGLRYFISER